MSVSITDTGGPVLVTVNIYLRSISKIDDVNMEYSSQFTFREEWWDPRLAYGRLADEETEVPPFVILATTEHADTSQQIWMPDTFVRDRHSGNGNTLDEIYFALVGPCSALAEPYSIEFGPSSVLFRPCLPLLGPLVPLMDPVLPGWARFCFSLAQSCPSLALFCHYRTLFCSCWTQFSPFWAFFLGL